MSGDGPEIDLSPDRTVSRSHAEVFRAEGDLWLRDMGSRHGTYRARQRVRPSTPVRCPPGTPIHVGSAELMVVGADWHRVRHGALSIEFTLRACFSHSIATATHRLFGDVVAMNWDAEPLEGGCIELDVQGAQTTRIEIPRLEGYTRHPLANLSSVVDMDALSRRTEPVMVRPEVVHNGKSLSTHEIACTLLAHDDWSYRLDDRPTLACFVEPGHPQVLDLARTSAAGMALQAGPPEALERIFHRLASDWHIDYRKDRSPSLEQSQKIRLTDDLLWDSTRKRGEGTCLDLALLIAACLESLRMQPLIALVDLGSSWHALVGAWERQRSRIDLMPSDTETLLDEAVWLDPNACTRDAEERSDLDGALGRARAQLSEHPLVFALDIAVARELGFRSLR